MTFATTAGIDTTGNDSDVSDGFLLKVAFFCIIIPLSLAGNSLVCIAFCTDKKLKRVPSNFLLVSLAAADILLTLIVMICTFVEVIKNKWIFGAEFCTFYICTDIMCCTASILSLCAISIDRYLRIKYALRYELMMSPEKIGLAVFIIWATSGLLSFGLVHLGWHKLPNSMLLPDDVCIFQASFTYALISSCISFYIPSIIMMVIYYKIFRIAGLHVHHIESHNISNKQNRKKSLFETKAAFTLGITTGVFFVCWLPFFICNVLARWSPNMVSRHFFIFSLYAGYSNSCFNPMIYSIFNTEYRGSFVRILCCKKQNIGSLPTSLKSSKIFSLSKQHQMINSGSLSTSLKSSKKPSLTKQHQMINSGSLSTSLRSSKKPSLTKQHQMINSGSLSTSLKISKKPSPTTQHQMIKWISPENSCTPPEPALEIGETMDN